MMLLVGVAFAGDYERLLYERLREKTVYRESYAAMTLKAVWMDDTLRSAQDEKRAALGGTAPTADPSLTVVFGAYSHWRKELTIAGDGTATWTARAWRGANACTLLDVQKVDRPASWELTLYPFLSAWDTLWTARFDASCGDGPLRFELVGPRGAVEARW